MGGVAHILILSEAWDLTAAVVVGWLQAWGRPTFWLHADELITELHLPFPGSARLELARGPRLDLSEVAAVWHRQGLPRLWLPEVEEPGLAALLQAEAEIAVGELYDRLRRLPSIGLLPPGGLSQLQQLSVAAAQGLATPETLVTSAREELYAFVERVGEVVTKRLHYPPVFAHAGQRYSGGGARLLGLLEVAALGPRFAPALAQARVPRAFDLRVFYLRGEFFPMALLPPAGEAVAVDSREADARGQLRRVPYRLPDSVQAKLGRLMEALRLDTGSLDLVVTPDDEHVFLEVNPQGQLDWLSFSCGYQLERRLAEALVALADGRAA